MLLFFLSLVMLFSGSVYAENNPPIYGEGETVLPGIFVCNESGNQTNPRIFEDTVVWQDDRNNDNSYDIYMKNLTTGIEAPICTAPGAQINPVIYGNIIVWEDYRDEYNGGSDIYMYDLTTGLEKPVCTDFYNQYDPEIYKNIIIWTDERNWGTSLTDIYMYNITTGIESPVCTAPCYQSNPSIYENKVVWEDARKFNSDVDSEYDSDIYMKDLTTGIETPICTDPEDQSNPCINKDKIVWEELIFDARYASMMESNITVFDLNTNKKTVIFSGAGKGYCFPKIYDDTIVWQGEIGVYDGIITYNIQNGNNFIIQVAEMPDIYNDTIVWQASYDWNYDIYGYNYNSPHPPMDMTIGLHESLIQSILANKGSLENGSIHGDLSGTFNFTNFEIVTFKTGSFANNGFFKGLWNANIDDNIYDGEIQGFAIYSPTENKITLNGAVTGITGTEGLFKGTLEETLIGSSILNKFQGVWKLGKIGDLSTFAIVNLTGTLNYTESNFYPNINTTVIQSIEEGKLSGDYEENVSAAMTTVMIDDENNPYNGEGYSVTSYSSNIGQGEGWAYNKLISPGIINIIGILTTPLESIAYGELNYGSQNQVQQNAPALTSLNNGQTSLASGESSGALSLSLSRVDDNLPIAPDIKITISGPGRVSPGGAFEYIIELINNGYKSATDVTLEVYLDNILIFNTASVNYNYEDHKVSWNFKELLPRSSKQFFVKVTVPGGLEEDTKIISFTSAKIKLQNVFYSGINWESTSKDWWGRNLYAQDLNALLIPTYMNTDVLTGALQVYYAWKDVSTSKNMINNLYGNGEYKIAFSHSGGTQTLMHKILTDQVKADFVFLAAPALISESDLLNAIQNHGVKKIFIMESEKDVLYELRMQIKTNSHVHYANMPKAVADWYVSNLGGSYDPDWGIYDYNGPTVTINEFTFIPTDIINFLNSLNMPIELPIQKLLESQNLNPTNLVNETFWISGSSRNYQELFSHSTNIIPIYYPGSWNPIKVHENLLNDLINRYKNGLYPFDGTFPDLKKRDYDEYAQGDYQSQFAVDESTITVVSAHDPNILYGPDGPVSPGQQLNYRVEFENIGNGIAYGVYFTDKLSEFLDDTTLDIGPIRSTFDNSIIGSGSYNPATRTITWSLSGTGEVGSHQGGYADFSINVNSDATDGTEIINYATVYFPSVPEETKTNGIVSIVDLLAPTANATPVGGNFNETKTIILNASDSVDPNPRIYYTIDGSTPTVNSNLYNGPITISKDTVLRFFAIDESGKMSPIYTETYNIQTTSENTEQSTDKNINQDVYTVNAASEISSQTIGMQETGLPINYLILAILVLFGGLATSKRK